MSTRRVALVTGGAGGIGGAVCEQLAADGFAVAVADIDLAAADRVASDIDGYGVVLDVCDFDSVGAAVTSVQHWAGDVVALVNCAGLDILAPFHETDEQLQRHLLEINLGGPLRVTRALLPGMLRAGWGRIVNISSDAGRLGAPLEVLYSASKGGVIAATKALAREYAQSGITVNCVSPGPTDTALFHRVNAASDDGELATRRMVRAIPMQRLGRPEEIAAAVRFFVSEAASFVTGQTMSVSGGLTMV